jgi:beta-lactamase regulating signal transducer with metallopeptidase domain
MTVALLIELAWKSALIAGATLLLLHLLARRSAAERSLVAHLGLAAVLFLPAATILVPELRLAAPEPIVEAVRVAPGQAVDATPAVMSIAATDTLPVDPARLVELGYPVPAAVLLALLLVAILRLGGLKRRSRILADPRWHAALAGAQQRLGFKHGAALLVSPEVAAPVSWGFVRPTILLSVGAERDARHAEALIAHELAHVASFDWLKLLAGRLTTAMFWFNPLVWLLARRCHDLCEEAADDAVLRAEVKRPDYAELLVDTARRSAGPMLFAVHGVAPTESALGRRVASVLDASRRRSPAGLGWTTGCMVMALGLSAPLAGVELVHLPAALAGVDARAGDRAAAQLASLDHPSTRALAEAIRHRDWDARRPAGQTTFHLPAAVPPLVTALRDDEAVVRKIAVWGLSEMRPGALEAAGAVAALLRDPDPEVRGQAARALGDMGAAAHSHDVARLLRDIDAMVGRQAAHALGDLRDPASRADLEEAMRHPDPGIRAQAHWALRQIGEAEEILARYRTR